MGRKRSDFNKLSHFETKAIKSCMYFELHASSIEYRSVSLYFKQFRMKSLASALTFADLAFKLLMFSTVCLIGDFFCSSGNITYLARRIAC